MRPHRKVQIIPKCIFLLCAYVCFHLFSLRLRFPFVKLHLLDTSESKGISALCPGCTPTQPKIARWPSITLPILKQVWLDSLTQLSA